MLYKVVFFAVQECDSVQFSPLVVSDSATP